jgi:exopolyphosphatase/guanosine-5'-triphosphate,3'-diphosphate pyrophosphatase
MKKKFEVIASIEIGSNYLRIIIAQINIDGSIHVLEELVKATNIGKDTFSKGRIAVSTIRETCESLKGFALLMREYKVNSYIAVATSGIREAENREYIIEQIRLASGVKVKIINSAEERFYIYKDLKNHDASEGSVVLKESIIVNITSGGIEVSTYEKGKLKFTEYIKLGPLRIREVLGDLEDKTISFPKIMEEFIEGKIYLLKSKIKEINIKNFIGLGGELNTILQLCTNIEEDFIKGEDIVRLYNDVYNKCTEQIAEVYKIPMKKAELLLPNILILNYFLKVTDVKGIYIPKATLRYGILYSILDDLFNKERKNEAIDDIINSVWYIAMKYGVDKKHGKQVGKIALSIFDQTKKLHKLGDRGRLYLQVASILHDSGNYVGFNDHEIHSYNIIITQSIMGLSDSEIMLIANIARYHANELPNYNYGSYKRLSDEEKITVSKLSAILKIAESLDISHKQKITDINVINSQDKLLLKICSTRDNLLEKWSFINNKEFFQEVMGIELELK